MAKGLSQVVSGKRAELVPVPGPVAGFAEGLSVGLLCDDRQGSVHMEVALSQLAPTGYVGPHVHPFEESFYVLSGRGFVQLGGRSHRVGRDDFGFAPIGIEHAWSNSHDEPLCWLRVRAPQPRPIGPTRGTYPVPGGSLPDSGRPVDEYDPTVHFVGHFDEEDLPPPGPLSMPGYHGLNVRTVSIRMMVDAVLGAVQHSMFMVQFAPSEHSAGPAAKEHYHPFEEMFYFLSGTAVASLDGEERRVGPGDLLFLGVNSSHGIRNAGRQPVRWIEVQAPMPPPSHAFFFADDWRRLEPEHSPGGEPGDGGIRSWAAKREST